MTLYFQKSSLTKDIRAEVIENGVRVEKVFRALRDKCYDLPNEEVRCRGNSFLCEFGDYSLTHGVVNKA